MKARVFVVALAMFAVAALLGAGFALLGPVKLIRILGMIALVAGASGCLLQLYALREFAPRVHALLLMQLRGHLHLHGARGAGAITRPAARRYALTA